MDTTNHPPHHHPRKPKPPISTSRPALPHFNYCPHRLRPFLVCIAAILLTLAVSSAHGDGDWQNHCGPCHCTWNSGKKQADCKSHAFQQVPRELTSELQVIDLSYNQIPELTGGEFEDAGLANMHKIYMRNATTQEVHRDAFRGLEVLIELDLSHNLLRSLQPGTFRATRRLRTLLLNGNQLERLENGLFAEMQFLYKLEVRDNRLHHIGAAVFERSLNVMNILLDQNRLSVLQPETFANMSNLKELSLNGNPWNCTCTLQQFTQFVLAHNLYTPPTSCVHPAHLKGRLWSDLVAENFACRPRIVQPQLGGSGAGGASGSAAVAVEALGDNVTLTCRVVGTPLPDIVWQHNGRVVNAEVLRRVTVRAKQEVNRVEGTTVLQSELTVVGVVAADRGEYVCRARNAGGEAAVMFRLSVPVQRSYGGVFGSAIGGGSSSGAGGADGGDGLVQQGASGLLVVVCLVVIVLLAVLIVVIVLLCCYCRRIKKYAKNGSISESGLMMAGKMEKGGGGGIGGGGGTALMGGSGVANSSGGGGGSGGSNHNGGGGGNGGGMLGGGDSMLEGSVIMEMQKSLLTDVNPVEKPPRRVELDGHGGMGDGHGHDDGHELKKTLLDDTIFANRDDDETQSVSLSDTTARSRTTYIDDGYGTNLPPDLLAFPSRFAQSPSLQSSISNIPEHHSSVIGGGSLYITAKSPPSVAAGSPIYQHHHLHHPLLGGGGGNSSIYAPTTSTPGGIGSSTNSGYRTLQLPKQRNNHLHSMALPTQQQQHQLLQHHQQQQQQHNLHNSFLQHQHQQQHLNNNGHLGHHMGTLRASHSPYGGGGGISGLTNGNAAAAQSPLAYPTATVVLKQGYVTIPRKPRTPSWTPSLTSTMTADYPLLTSPTPSASTVGTAGGGGGGGAAQSSSSPATSPDAANATAAAIEPVYDNLGLRTTASGNSVLNLHKLAVAAQAAQAQAAQAQAAQAQAAAAASVAATGQTQSTASPASSIAGAKFTMKDRPLPATPRNNTTIPATQVANVYEAESLQQQRLLLDSMHESLYGSARSGSGSVTDSPRSTKVPPRPPPKPKKKTGAAAAGLANGSSNVTGTSGAGSSGHLFEDECEDGTEV